MNRENLTKLAAYLESLPADYQHFDMGVFYHRDDYDTIKAELEYAEDPTAVTHCGTAACALGHGPAAGIAPTRVTGTVGIDWSAYGLKFIDQDDTATYEFLFSGHWDQIDNTLRGAAARIRYVLDDNPVPHYDPDVYKEYLVP